jgi:membrane protein implicated in regulation of membrane protease activity
VGYWSIVAVPISVYLFGILALVMFLAWYTAVLFLTICVLISAFAIRRHSKHVLSEKYDDRLTDARMRDAIEWIIIKGGGTDKNMEDSIGS